MYGGKRIVIKPCGMTWKYWTRRNTAVRYLKESAHMLCYEDFLRRPSLEINIIWELPTKKKTKWQQIFNSSSSCNKREVSVSAVKHGQQHLSAGRLGLKLQVLHTELFYGIMDSWIGVLVCEFGYLIKVNSIRQYVFELRWNGVSSDSNTK